MTNKKATRRALFMSIISLILCCSMLVGTTFAWFTDTVESGRNTIAAGNLDVELVDGDGNTIQGSTELFHDVDPNLWEPGAVAYENLQVKNVGTLALKYDLNLTVLEETVTEEGYKLSDVIKVGIVKGGVTSADRDAVVASVDTWTPLSSFNMNQNGVALSAKQNSDVFGVVLYWQPNANELDNRYNMNNENQGKKLELEIGINLFATQLTEENDSFGPDYDYAAPGDSYDGEPEEPSVDEEAKVVTIENAEQLVGFANDVNGGKNYSGYTVLLADNLNLAGIKWTPIGQTGASQFAGSFDGNGKTIYNLNVDNSSLTTEYGCSGLFGWVEQHGGNNSIKNLTIDGVVINSHRYSGAVAGWINIPVTNCTVKNVTINCGYYNDDVDGTKVGALVGYADNGSALTGNTVDTATLIAYGDVGGLAGVAQTTVSVDGNTVKNVEITYTSNAKSNPGEIVSTRVTPNVGSNTAQNVTINRAIIASSVQMLNNELNKLPGDAMSAAAMLQNCNEPDGVAVIPAAYTGTLTIKDSTIKSVQAAGNANIVIEGNVVVNAKGSGVATAAETETAFDGSAITANGILNISGNGNLTAIAADVEAAFGIGGMNISELNIQNVHIVKVTGGGVQSKIVDTNYGKNDFEGAPAIGSGCTGAVINLTNVTVDEALGGSKGAGIGARYHTGVTVNIADSTINNVVGGSSSAGIGGSRLTKHASGEKQNITINITNSNINATGGDFGAGIGSGYNTYCAGVQPTPVISVTIDAASNITAQGGWLGAGIGTGHNAIGFVGNIACDTSNVKAGNSEDPSWCCWGNPCTNAEDIGLGVLSKNNFPDIFKSASSQEELNAAVSSNGKVDVTLGTGEYTLPSASNSDVTISGTKDTVITVDKPAYHGSDVTFEGVTVKGSGYATGVQHVDTVTYNGATIVGEMCLYGDKVVFNKCNFELNGGYIWTYAAKEVEFNNCTFNTTGKAILIYNEGGYNSNVTVNGCTFNATEGAKAGAIANQNCAAIEIDSTYGSTFALTTSGNTYSDNFSGEWRIKGINTAVTVNGTQYSTIAIDGKTMTIDADKNVTVIE